MLRYCMDPQIYWRVLGLIFTAVVIYVLYAASNNSTTIKSVAAFQSGEYHLGYQLFFKKMNKWSPETKTAYSRRIHC